MIPRLSPNYSLRELGIFLNPFISDKRHELSQDFCERSGYPHVLFTRYGRTGLYYLLKVLMENSNRKKVIISSYTCVVVTHAIVQAGGIPIFVDNKIDELQPAPEELIQKIDNETLMVIQTHLFGISQNAESLYNSIKKKDPEVFVVQDCAHSFFSTYNGVSVSRWGDAAIFGMNISKLINSVHGGALTLKEPALREKISTLLQIRQPHVASTIMSRIYGIASIFATIPIIYSLVYWLDKNLKILSEVHYYDENVAELPKDFSKLPNKIELAIGASSFKSYDARIKNRSDIAKFYIQALERAENVVTPKFSSGNSWSHFPVLVPKQQRDRIKNRIEKELNLEVGILVDYAVAEMAFYKKNYRQSSPIAKDTSERILNLPIGFLEGLNKKRNWQNLASKVAKIVREESRNS